MAKKRITRRQMVLYSLSIAAVAVLPGCGLPKPMPPMPVGKVAMPPYGYLKMMTREIEEKGTINDH